MRPFVVNGNVWRVTRVPAGDPRLIDRTGQERLATTDPRAMTIYVSENVVPPLLDQVIMHEVTHAITVSWDLLDKVRSGLPEQFWVGVEEWSVSLLENHALEALEAAREVLGRPVCIRGVCYAESRNN